MMKRFYYGAMATGLLFAACSSDNLSEPSGNGPADADKTLYVKMAIHGDVADGTRAGNAGDPEDNATDFDPGTGESGVKNAYFVFYDANGKQVGDVVSITLTDPVTENVGETVEKYYKNVVPVSIKKNDLNPAQVICYINPISPASLQNPLSTIQTVTREKVEYTADGSKYFPMSNSVYYLNNTADAPQIAVPINEKTQLFDTKEEALAANDGEAIDVYVERYASKLTFSVKENATYTTYVTATAEAGGDETVVKLDWKPSRWALNAEANETYVVKSYRQPSATGQILPDNYTYADANTALNGTLTDANSWKWNNASYHRSYWACSPAYFTEKYPEVAGDVNKYNLNQTYYTYEDVMKGDKGYVQNAATPQYFRETTVGTAALQGGNPQAAVPSVIFVGSYEVTLNNAKVIVKNADGVDDNPSFYTYVPGSNGNALVFFNNKANSADSEVAGGVSMLKRFIQQTTVLFTNEGTAENPNYVALNTKDTKVMENLVASVAVIRPDDKVLTAAGTTEDGPMKVPARQRTLQIQSLTSLNGVYIATGSGYKTIVADDAEGFNSTTQVRLTEANRILMQQVGFANYYENGHSYYNIPVKHYGWYRPGNPNRTKNEEGAYVDNAGIDWSKVMVGDFGMVRNHSYNIQVNSIKGLATGIGGKEPIVPPADTRDYYVAYKVRILKWAVVPQQNVDL